MLRRNVLQECSDRQDEQTQASAKLVILVIPKHGCFRCFARMFLFDRWHQMVFVVSWPAGNPLVDLKMLPTSWARSALHIIKFSLIRVSAASAIHGVDLYLQLL